MTPSELNEIWCVGSLSGLMYTKGISPKLLVWLLRNALLNIFLSCSFAMHIFIQSIITWTFLKNDFYRFKAERISFHLVYVTGSAKTLRSHTSDFTTLTSHNFESTNDIDLKSLDAIEQ